MPPRIPFKRQTPPRVVKRRINGRIKARRVKVVDENGVMLGEMPTARAVQVARESGRDLVEVDARVRPHVCRLRRPLK